MWLLRSWVSPPRVMSRSGARYQPEPDPVQPLFLTTDPTGWRRARLPIGTLMYHADRTRQQTNLPPNPRRDAPVDQATAIPAISAPPRPHLNRCAAAYREEYDGNEYGGLPVNAAIFIC